MTCLEMLITADNSIPKLVGYSVLRESFFPRCSLESLSAMDLVGQPEFLHHPDTVPIEVDLAPLQTVPSRNWGVRVIVVPAFTPRDSCKPLEH